MSEASAPGCCSRFEWDRIGPAHLLHSHLVSPRALLFVRCLFALWLLPANIVLAIRDWGPNEQGLALGVTLSYLSWTAIVLYFILVTGYTIANRELLTQPAVVLNREPDLSVSLAVPDQAPSTGGCGGGCGCGGRCHKALWVMYEILTPTAFVVTIVYWSLLHKGKGLSWQDAHMHSANSLTMLTELLLNRLPVMATHSLFMLAFGTLYLCWSLAVHGVSGQFIYPFLNYDAARWSWVCYPAVLAFALLLYFGAFALVKLRERAFGTRKDNAIRADDPLATPLRKMNGTADDVL